MSQRVTGFYRLTQIPRLYTMLQHALGGPRTRQIVTDRYIRPFEGARILDIGCGSASLLPELGAVRYTGIDSNPAHILEARTLHGERGRFLVGDAEALEDQFEPPFDIIMAIGVLHHLDDAVVGSLAAFAARMLGSGGRFVTIDPAFTDRQNPVARFLASRDSGQNVRQIKAYQALLEPHFPMLETEVRHDMLRVPYTHCIMQGSLT